jgi:hypothetical protein
MKLTQSMLAPIAMLVIAGFACVSAPAAQNFYTVDFNSPLNQIGQPPTTGAGSDTPSRILFGSPTVVSSFGHLTDQPLVFSGIYYQQIQFDLGRGVSDYSVDFDFETRNLNSSLFAFSLLMGGPGWGGSFYLHGRGYIGVPPSNSPYLPGWTDNELHHMRITVAQAGSAWTLQLDDQAPVTRSFGMNVGDVQSMVFSMSAWHAAALDNPEVQVAIDNIVIGTSVPEPSSAALSLGAVGLGLLWRQRIWK